jgi:polysaccharide export outer membrane protein
MKLNLRMLATAVTLALFFAALVHTGARVARAQSEQQREEAQADAEQKKGRRFFGLFGGGGQKKPKKQPSGKPTGAAAGADERLEGDDTLVVRPDVPEETLANRSERINENEDAAVPYYNNFLSSYRLGPEDVISITVFGLERYSRPSVTIPPDGRISYYGIREGVHVAGKTTQQVADEITKHLDEIIIDPKVTVSLEKAMSARFGVVGDVGRPGIYTMTRRLSVYEALNEAGGVLPTGNKKKVAVMHWNPDRTMKITFIDIAAIEKGRAADNYFLSPGDQVLVTGNRYKTFEKVLKVVPIISFARIFTGGW